MLQCTFFYGGQSDRNRKSVCATMRSYYQHHRFYRVHSKWECLPVALPYASFGSIACTPRNSTRDHWFRPYVHSWTKQWFMVHYTLISEYVCRLFWPKMKYFPKLFNFFLTFMLCIGQNCLFATLPYVA